MNVFVDLLSWSVSFFSAYGAVLVGMVLGGVWLASRQPGAAVAWLRVRAVAIVGLFTPLAILGVGTVGAVTRDRATSQPNAIVIATIYCLLASVAVDAIVIWRRSEGHRLGYGLVSTAVIIWSLSAAFVAGMAASGSLI